MACIEVQASQSLSENTFLVLFRTFEEDKNFSISVLFYLVVGKKDPVINSTHRHKSDKIDNRF